MPSRKLADCLSAGLALSDADQTQFLQRVDALMEAGEKQLPAERKALAELMQSVEAQRAQIIKAASKPAATEDTEQPAHIRGIHGWWGVNGTAGQADAMTAAGRAAALKEIGVSNEAAGYGSGGLAKVYWTYLPDDVRTKLAALRRDGWTPEDAKAPAPAPVEPQPKPSMLDDAQRRYDVADDQEKQIIKPALDQLKAEAAAAAPVAPAPAVTANTVFTEDAAEKARARLRAKLRNINSGIDPEMLVDGVVLAGYHIEKGARTFAAYARAMVDDLGEEVKPFLKSFYMATKYDPRAAAFAKDMDSAEAMEAFDLDTIGAQSTQEQPAPETEVQNDPAPERNAPAVDRPLAERAQEQPVRGAIVESDGAGRPDDRELRGDGGRSAGRDDAQGDVGYGRGNDRVPDAPARAVEPGAGRLPSNDFRPGPGDLTRKGSWHATAARNVDIIELALKIEKEARPATAEEQALLSKYVGFGAGEIRNALFPVPGQWARQQDPKRLIWPSLVDARWKPLAERLDALPREWQQSILQSTQYAHYTSEGIVRATWGALQRLGFTGGKILEPGGGIGNFPMLMPDSIRATSKFTGIEFDGPTALIARLLSPSQNMLHDDFIKRKLPRNFFDVGIGNPPFSQTPIEGDPDYAKFKFVLHDFFFAKSIDRIRPGGLLAFVTSKGTMDKQTDKARKYLAERADLVGAIRLPSTAFGDNAGTSVVTDVIFLRKRLEGEAPGGQPWQEIKGVSTPDGDVFINEYFAANPHMVLGQNRISGNVDDMGRRINSNGRGGEKYTVVSYDTTPEELDAKFAEAVTRLPANVYSPLKAPAAAVRAETAKMDFDPSVKREGVVYAAKDGTLMRVENGVGVELTKNVKLSAKEQAWFKSYVGLRDAVQAARLAQAQDGNWEKPLKALNKAYDEFRKTHGPVNDFRIQVRKSTDEDGNIIEVQSRVFKNRRLLREDYDSAIVTQLESINEAGDIEKAAFLKGRTIGKPVTRDVKTVGDALAVSLDETGRFNLEDVARRVGVTKDEAIDALGDSIYKAPSGEWQLADEYLSGDVVAKLEEAEHAARIDPTLARNVEALKAAIPEKLGPSQISVKLGASWVPVEHVNEFAKEIEAGTVTFDAKTESWQVAGGNERTGRKAGAEYGTAARSPSELLEAVLNSRSVVVKHPSSAGKDLVGKTDAEATTAANEAVRKIKDKFKSWVWTDSERATTLVEIYNQRFNNIAPRKFDGSHMTLPGVSLRFNLHPHQKRAIWRQVQTGNTYLAHAVGAGKTIEMIAGGMEQKRLGLIQKPIYAVPNHMLEQFANEFMELYPLANIMVADDENFSAERRKAFVAAATLNAPDAIIITHSAFERIGVKEESVAPIRDAMIEDLQDELDSADKTDRVRRSQLEQQIEAVTQRFERIVGAGAKDSTIKFEDMGVDFIYADEAHAFRKLDFSTNQKVKGIDPNGSKRSLDMFVKTRYLQSKRPGRAMVFASGTPVTNTMGELHTIMRYFDPEGLERDGIASFDAWARQFGEVGAALEANAAGRYETVERFSKFDNVPELMSRVRQFMDVLTSENLGALVKRPDLEGGKPNLITIEPTQALKGYMESVLAPRLAESRAWKPSKDEPSNPDPVIAIISDGRFAALDPRFFGGKVPPGTETPLTRLGDEIVKEYKATARNEYLDRDGKVEPIKGGTQIVFYNLGFGEGSMKNRGFNARDALTRQLTAGGVKREHIAWFDEADTDAKKEAIFKAMRSGQLRVLIGSAKKMGTGVNVQKRLTGLQYFDPPWFPADVEQPHGRILRQGNQNKSVRINWFASKGSYASTMWQMVGRKQRFIDQAMSGDKNLRSMDDMSEASQYEQAAAVSSGDPRALQLAGLRQDVERFERLQKAHASEQVSVRSGLSSAEWAVESLTKRLTTYKKAFKAIGETYFTFKAGEIDGKAFDKQTDFGQALKDRFNQVAADAALNPSDKPVVLGKVGALEISMEPMTSWDAETKAHVLDGRFQLLATAGGYDLDIAAGAGLGADVDALGLVRRIVNAANSLDRSIRETQEQLTTQQNDIERLKRKRGAPFEHERDLADKYAELKTLEEELRQEGLAAAAEAKKAIDEKAAKSADATPAADGEAPAQFSRAAKSQADQAVAESVDQITAKWANAPGVEVVFDMSDPAIPADVRETDANKMSQGAGAVEGFYHPGTGKVFLMSSVLKTPGDVARVLFHEVLGHHGLRGAFGDRLNGLLDQLAERVPERIAKKAEAYKLDLSKVADRRAAAEEVLAELAQTRPQSTWVQQAIAKVREFLRYLGLPVEFTDADIVAQFIVPARGWVERGRAAERNGATAFSRGTTGDMPADTNAPGQNGDAKGAGSGSGDTIEPDGEIAARRIIELHGARSKQKRDELVRRMKASGWAGRPVLAYEDGNGINAITGSHRIAAARVVGIDVPYVLISEDAMSFENEYGQTVFDFIGNDDFYLADFLAQTGDARASSLMQLENADTGFDGELNDQQAPVSGGAMFSRAPAAEDLRAGLDTVRERVADTIATMGDGKMSWWDKSVGTQAFKALRNKDFRRVYTAVQSAIQDTAFFANDAADLAAGLLPKLEKFSDIKRQWSRNKPDEEAAGKAAFAGTEFWIRDADGVARPADEVIAQADKLTIDQKARMLLRDGHVSEAQLKGWKASQLDIHDGAVRNKYEAAYLKKGVVFSDAELKAHFKLTPEQIALYRETRAAVDRSLQTTAASMVARLLAVADPENGLDPALKAMVSEGRVGEFRAAVDKLLTESAQAAGLDVLNAQAKGMTKAEAKAALDAAQSTATKVNDLWTQAEKLSKHGYAPLMRFGQYTVDVKKGDERVFFGMYESRRDQARAMRALRDEFGADVTITKGEAATLAHKSFQGISPETMALFGEHAGIDKDSVFQEYVKLATANHSGLRRMIHRKGVAGFSEDLSRVLSAFLVSNARLAAHGLHQGELAKSIDAIPKQDGDVRDEAEKLRQYVQDPQEGAPMLKNMLFSMYLGGSVASAAVNMTQPVMMTFPYLSQWGAKSAAAELVKATKDAVSKNPPKDVAEALARAEKHGVVSPQEIHQLQAEAARTVGSNPIARTGAFLWGSFFSLAEQFNRRSTFIAAYRTAVREGMADPYAFAAEAIERTQGNYSKGNRPNWARSTAGGVVFTFKQYSIAYVEFLTGLATQGAPGSIERKNGRKAALMALAVLMLAAGTQGLPGADDLDDLVDTVGQKLGYNTQTKLWKRQVTDEVFGRTGGAFVRSGVSAFLPLDIAGRVSVGNLLPGSRIFTSDSSDKTRDILEILGPAGSLFTGIANEGLWGAVPVAAKNVVKAADMVSTGAYRDTKGRTVMETNGVDAAMKLVGFQPSSVAEEQRRVGSVQAAVNGAKQAQSRIMSAWAEAMFTGDKEGVADAKEMLATWNEKNPDTPISIKPQALIARVRQMGQDREARVLKATPKVMRPQVLQTLAGSE